MNRLTKDPAPMTPSTLRLLASRKVQADETPHPAMLALARRPRGGTRKNRRLTEFLRIERGREA